MAVLRRAPDEPSSDGDGMIDVFATGSTVLHVPEPDAVGETPTPSHQIGDLAQLLPGPARPGHRPGVRPAAVAHAGARHGGRTDVVRPMPVAPQTAIDIVLSGVVLARPLPHVCLAGNEVDRRFLAWPLTIHRAHHRAVPGTLHLLASPSMVVSVLELVPRRSPRFGSGGLVSVAVAAVEELASRIESEARRRARSHRSVAGPAPST